MEHNSVYGGKTNIYDADIAGGATDAYGQQQYHGYQQTAAVPGQGPGMFAGQWQQHPLHQPQHQPAQQLMRDGYGQAMHAAPAPSAAAYGMPMPQQLMQAAPAPDQHDDTLKAVRDMPTPFQQLYSYR
jgi:hypothetical protein